MFWGLEARISSFYYTRILQLNQEKIRKHPWKKWENICWGTLKLKNFDFFETLGVHFLNFWNPEFLDFWYLKWWILENHEKSQTRNLLTSSLPSEFLEKLGYEFSFDQKKHEPNLWWNEPTFLFLGNVIPITNQRTDSHPCIRFLHPMLATAISWFPLM